MYLPDKNYFRFETSSGYEKHYKGLGVKEMDVCWLDQEKELLYVIELKDWNEFIAAEHLPENLKSGLITRGYNIVSKIVGALMLLSSVEMKRNGHIHLSGEIPFSLPLRKKFLVVVNCDLNNEVLLQSIEAHVRAKTTGLLKACDYGKVQVIHKKMLEKLTEGKLVAE
ncbi:MAG: hypothetical protein V4543_12915 [Bacteroidota bacterium]